MRLSPVAISYLSGSLRVSSEYLPVYPLSGSTESLSCASPCPLSVSLRVPSWFFRSLSVSLPCFRRYLTVPLSVPPYFFDLLPSYLQFIVPLNSQLGVNVTHYPTQRSHQEVLGHVAVRTQSHGVRSEYLRLLGPKGAGKRPQFEIWISRAR